MVGQAVILQELAGIVFALLVGGSVVFGAAATALAQTAQVAPPLNPVTDNVNTSAAITPSDTTLLPLRPTKAIFNGNATACNVVMRLAQDTASVTWSNVQPGSWLPVAAIQVYQTGTSCTGLVATYGP